MLSSLATFNSIVFRIHTLPPDIPTNFTVSPSASYVTLSFTPPGYALQYTVTATPTTNTHEIVVTRTFTSGSGYKLEVLSANTTYTISLVATNMYGSSAAVTTSVTTLSASVPVNPTLSYTTDFFPGPSPGATARGYYSFIAVPKTTPNIVYIYAFANPSQLYYSTDGGSTYVDISGRLSLSAGNNVPGIGLACSDDGKVIYAQPEYGRTNVSTDYGLTFSYNAGTDTPNNGMALLGTLCTNPTGEISIVAGNTLSSLGTNSGNIINWSANFGNTYSYITGNSIVSDIAINASTNRVYYVNHPINATLYYYTASSKADLLALDFANATFSTVSFSIQIAKVFSVGNITMVLTNNGGVHLSTNGTTFSQLNDFSTGIPPTIYANARSWVVIEPYVGFIMICGMDPNVAQPPAIIYYSINSGASWTQYNHSEQITGASSATCVLQDTNVKVLVTSGRGTSGQGRLYTIYIPVTIT
jgi:hypothetical protein